MLLQDATLGGSDRIAAQIVTGVGFLGAGVILRDGLSVRGINTAATLWCAAAVGALAGSGSFQLRGVHSEDLDSGMQVEVHAVLTTVGTPDNAVLEQAVGRLSLQPGVTEVGWEAIPSDENDDDMEGSVTPRRGLMLWRGRRAP